MIAALAGILFLTLSPFRFDFHAKLPGNTSPFLLGTETKTGGNLDVFLNVLLFVPLGFGLAEKLRERKMSRMATFSMALAAGAILSYAIEFTQIYIPMRDSGWEDVFTNSTGSVVGFFLFELLGAPVIRLLSRWEAALRSWLTPGRIAVLLFIYFLAWFGLSARLQTRTRLSNWYTDCLLFLGNEATGQNSWQGEVETLQIGDRAITDSAALQLSSGQISGDAVPWRVEYEFKNSPPYNDVHGFLPALDWTPATPVPAATDALVLNGESWLSSGSPITGLIGNVQKSSQFAIHIICSAAVPHIGTGQIISISRSPSFTDLTVKQDEANLVFWFRSPLSAKRAILAWYVPNVFTDSRPRNIVYSYDGANLALYVDGKKSTRLYHLGPGATLAKLLRKIRPSELEGYNDIYCVLVFFPAGIILGIAAERRIQSNAMIILSLALYSVASALLLELILVRVSGRPFSISNFLFSALLVVAGFLWIRSDEESPFAARLGQEP
ncbi:MAG: VanZ family protein [Candidatus Acidiferrales bacterium]